jgi:hypothetical protein
VDRIIQIIRSLAAAESDREREAIQGQLSAELRGLSAQELGEVRTKIRAEATELAAEETTPANVELLELFAAQYQVVESTLAALEGRDELSTRSNAALAALEGRHDPARDHVQPPEPESGQQPDPAEQGGGEGGQASEGGGEGAPNGGQQAPNGGEGGQQPPSQQAAGERRERNLGTLAGEQQVNPERGPSQIGARIVISGDVPGFTAGTVADRDTISRAFVNKARALASSAGGGRYDVVHIEFAYPDSHTLGQNYSENMDKIHEATTPQALTAAAQSGGLCLPLEVIYDIDTVGVTDRPVRDALTPFRVERGGIQYRLPFDALQMTDGLGVWGQDNDQSVINDGANNITYESGNDSQGDPFGPKTCYVVDCPGVVEASIYSTYLCLEFANMTSRFDTEWVNATNQSSQVAASRFAENQLLSRILTSSKIVYGAPSVASGAGFSAVREMLANYDKVISYYRNRHRLNGEVPLHTIMPLWVINMLQTDLARMMNTSGDVSGLFAVAQASIEGWFRTRNVNVTWHLDGLAATASAISGIMLPAQTYATLNAGDNVPGWPNAVDTVLYREGDWMFLDGGTLDIGLVRDSNLNLRNRYQTFSESFEGVAFKGLESLRVVMPLVPNGASSGTIAPPTNTDGMSAYTKSGG